LQSAGVSTRFVSERPGNPTGLAVVWVTPDGDNAIVVAAGANASPTPGDLAAAAAFDRADLLLLQLEVPLETVLAAARTGRERGALVVLNAAPARDLPTDLLAVVDVLVVNQGEAAALSGSHNPRDAATYLRGRGPGVVVVTLGGDGCAVADDEGVAPLSAYPVEAVDTTGAGDCFAAAVGLGLAEGRSALGAARFAAAAAAISVARPGAQFTPGKAEIERFRRQHGPSVDS
jgi:ribokinase